jgi:hypothetical protein
LFSFLLYLLSFSFPCLNCPVVFAKNN